MPARPLCCLCGDPIRGTPEKVPGNGELPPACAARAREIGAPATGWLHKEAGRWCYNKVTVERKEVRPKRVTRGGYDAGDDAPNNLAPKKDREVHNLTIGDVNLDGEAALGLLFISQPPEQGAGGADTPDAVDAARPDEPTRKTRGADRSTEAACCSSADATEPTTTTAARQADARRLGGLANRQKLEAKLAAVGRSVKARRVPQTLAQRTAPASRYNLSLLPEPERELREQRLAERDAHVQATTQLGRAAAKEADRADALERELAVFRDAASLCEEAELIDLPGRLAKAIVDGHLDLSGAYAACTHAAVQNLHKRPEGWRWQDKMSKAALAQIAFMATRQSGTSYHKVRRGDPRKRGRAEPLPSKTVLDKVYREGTSGESGVFLEPEVRQWVARLHEIYSNMDVRARRDVEAAQRAAEAAATARDAAEDALSAALDADGADDELKATHALEHAEEALLDAPAPPLRTRRALPPPDTAPLTPP